MTPEAAITGGQSPDRFVTTRWSVVLSCTDSQASTQTVRNALAQLCQTYWRPIFAFVSRSGYSIQDAQDLTQDFFLMVLEGDLLKRADPSRGRFRTLLLKALVNFLADDTVKKHARKRGGEVQFVSWDDWMAEAPSQLSISASTPSSVSLFPVSAPRPACNRQFKQRPRPTRDVDPHCGHAIGSLRRRIELEMPHRFMVEALNR